MEKNILTQKLIGCAIEVHKNLGPGFLDSSSESCLMYELHQAGFIAKKQVIQSINYKGMNVDARYRLDILMPDQLIIVLK